MANARRILALGRRHASVHAVRVRAGLASLAAAATALWTGLAAPDAAARTTATLDGNVVTFTVPLDLIGVAPTVRDPETGMDHDSAALLEELVEKFWNDQLSTLRYRDCITFKLDVQAQRKPAGADADPGHHGIKISSDPSLRSHIVIPGYAYGVGDFTAPYTQSVTGTWSYGFDQWTAGHEVGHLLGLDDDYLDNEKGFSILLPGRENSYMADSHNGSVDQALVDRLGKLAEQAGLDWPACGYQFDGVGFDWRPYGAYYHDDISGRVCGDPFKEPWIVSATVTNWIDPTNTGTLTAEVRVPGPNVETAGTTSELGRFLRLTFLPGEPPRLKVARLDGRGARQEATVPLATAKGCGK